MATIELSQIAHTYEPGAADPVYALKELNMVWKNGGTYALLGPSGCGKTTMLNIISGLVRPSQGRVLFDGADYTAFPTTKRNIAQVFQFPVIYTLMSVEENLAFPLICRKAPKSERLARVREVAELLNLADKLKKPARKLAADEKQLLSLGRGLVREDVTALLMDEPLTVIDPQLKFDIRRKLKKINERYGLTMVYVTHDQNEAMSFADTIVVMNHGEVIQVGSPQDLHNRPLTTYVGYFIGSPAMNFIQCRVADGLLQTGGGPVPIPAGISIPEGVKDLQLGIRPRYPRLLPSKAPHAVRGRVQNVQEFGNYRVAAVAVADETLRIKLAPEDHIPADQTWVHFPEDRISLYADGVRIPDSGEPETITFASKTAGMVEPTQAGGIENISGVRRMPRLKKKEMEDHMSKPKVAIVKTGTLKGNEEFLGGKFVRYDEDVAAVKEKIAETIALAVGSIDEIIKPGETVLIKPNLAFQAPPESFSVVDPRVIEGMVAFLKEQSQAKEVWVGDNPSLGLHVGRAKPAFNMAGMRQAAERGGADRVIFFDEEELVDVEIEGARLYRQAKIFKPFLDADRVINLPKMKTHLAGTVTLGVKNWQGIIPNIHPSGEQQDVHRLDLGQKCADLLRVREADLTFVDGIIAMEGQGPHAGTPLEMNLFIAGAQTVAVDSVAAYVMGFETVEIPAVRIAATEGLGERDIEKIDVVGTPISDVRTFFKRPMNDPIGLIPGINVVVQQTCPGCFANMRGGLDNFNRLVDTKDFVDKVGEVYIMAGGVPQLEPDRVAGKHLFIAGDCWKLFPSKDKVEAAKKVAKSVTEYPGCAPVYIFAQLNGDLQALYQKAQA